MRRAAVTVWFVLASAAACSTAWAQQPAESSLAIGARVWVTTGYSTNSTEGSELRWRGVDSVVTEVNVDYAWRRLVVLGSVGGGRITQGVLIDEDFTDSAHHNRIAVTRSDVDDTGLVYVNGDVGFRLLSWGPREQPGFIDGLLGYQYWFERYVGFGVTGVSTVGFIGTSVSPSIKVITQEYHWHSLRVGGRTQIPLVAGLSAKARAWVLPWSKSIVDDDHLLRSDLRHNPSFRDEADGGLGVQADAGLEYRIWRGLSVEAGFQYWRVKSGEGTSTARTIAGNVEGKLLENRTERYGPYVGVKYRF